MIIQANYLKENNNFDYIIIGGGPAGTTLANKLDKNKNILIVEAGDGIPGFGIANNPSSTVNDFYYQNTSNLYPIESSRISALGGGSQYWADNKLGYNNTIYPKRSEKFTQELINDEKKVIEIDQINFTEINHYSAEYFYEDLKSIINKKNTKIILNSRFINLNYDNENESATSINIKTGTNNFKVFGKFFIICTGGIESAKILLNEKKNNKKLDSFLNYFSFSDDFGLNTGSLIISNKNKLFDELNKKLGNYKYMYLNGDNHKKAIFNFNESYFEANNFFEHSLMQFANMKLKDYFIDSYYKFCKRFDKCEFIGSKIIGTFSNFLKANVSLNGTYDEDKVENINLEYNYDNILNELKDYIINFGSLIESSSIGYISIKNEIMEGDMNYFKNNINWGHHHCFNFEENLFFDHNKKIKPFKNIFLNSTMTQTPNFTPTIYLFGESIKLARYLNS